MVFSLLFPATFFFPLALCSSHTHAPAAVQRTGEAWAAFPDVINCGLSRPSPPHLTLLQLAAWPRPLITTYRSLTATSPTDRKGAPGTANGGPVRSAHVDRVHPRIQDRHQKRLLRAKTYYKKWDCSLVYMNWQRCRADFSLPAPSSCEFMSRPFIEFLDRHFEKKLSSH